MNKNTKMRNANAKCGKPDRGVEAVAHASEKHPAKSFPIVGIGASAGGLEALELFFKNVPEACGMGFVVVQHLDPNHKAMMPELLQKSTALPVLEIKDRTTVEPNHIYVIPPKWDLSILHGVLHLLEPVAPRGRHLPIDGFFRALAEDQKENSIGVILSGMGSDGTLGLRAIKEKDGAVFVQAPDSAGFDSMPRSAIDAGLADVVAPAEALAEKIIAYRQYVPQQRAQPDETLAKKRQSDLEKVVLDLRTQTGHNFSLYKPSILYRRIERRMALHQLAKIADYAHYLRQNSNEAELLFKELLIGVTTFFRDPAVWEQLKTEVIPELLAAHPKGGVLRAWVPACSTGEEAYSLAIIFREVLEQIKPDACYSLTIFATDLDNDAVDKARTGIYPLGITADVPEERLRRFFVEKGNGYRVSKEIREMVIFAQQNLVMDPPFTKLDLLTCRNLLIYLESKLQKKLMHLFHYSLNPEGALVLGSSETTGTTPNLFEKLTGKTRIYRKRESLAPSHQECFATASTRPLAEANAVVPPPAAPNLQELTDSLLLHHYSPSAVLSTSQGDIVYISGKLGNYLEPAEGKANLNIYAMAREGLSGPLTEAFAKAVRQEATATIKGVTVGTNGGTQHLDLTVQFLTEPAALQGMVLTVFTDAPAPKAKTGGGKTGQSAAHAPRVAELTKELLRSRQEQKTTREEMQVSQEELRSSNEELQSINEEMQSTNEELTTSREEMQSMNEEFQTLNHELQVKVDELMNTSDDMENLLNSTDIATLFLDARLNVHRFTEEMTSISNLIPGDTGRPITDIVSMLDYLELADDARKVLRTLVTSERQVAAHDGRWFAVRIVPYRTQNTHINGVVITFFNITKTKVLEATLREELAVLQTRFTKQTGELDTANALEIVMNKAQAVLEDKMTLQTVKLRQSRQDLKDEKKK